MLALLDFEPKFCPNCGSPIDWNDRQVRISFYRDQMPQYCRCTLQYRLVESSRILFSTKKTQLIRGGINQETCRTSSESSMTGGVDSSAVASPLEGVVGVGSSTSDKT